MGRVRGFVEIDVERCKGCELCIPVCPPSVLSMSETRNSHGYNYPILAPGCTGCQLCHAVCPDFVFTVYRELMQESDSSTKTPA